MPTLRNATVDDLPQMLNIFDEAFAQDRHTQLKIDWHGPQATRDAMAEALRTWLAVPHATLLIAENTETGAMEGWACWARISGKADQAYATTIARSGGAMSLVDQLEALTSNEIRACQRDVIKVGDLVHVLVAIVVAPACQGRGVGRALVEWGTERADAESRVCWVHASEAGARLFTGAGFRVHRELTVSLNQFAPPDNPTDWGSVTFRSMVR